MQPPRLPASGGPLNGRNLAGGDAVNPIAERSRRENFPVLSRLVPRPLRPAFAAVYRFCRVADDAADRPGSPEANLARLGQLRSGVASMYGGPAPPAPSTDQGAADRELFGSLEATVRGFSLPRRAFDDLLDAFEQDQRVNRCASFADLLDYCRRSADPVGRLVLKLFGIDDAERLALSDATCTALQLTNHLQDLRPDLLRLNRVYLPADVALAHDLPLETLIAAIRAGTGSVGEAENNCPACPPVAEAQLRALRGPLAATVRDLVQRTEALYERGAALPALLPRDAARPVAAFGLAGAAVLRRVAASGPGLAQARPAPPRGALALALLRAQFTAHAGRRP